VVRVEGASRLHAIVRNAGAPAGDDEAGLLRPMERSHEICSIDRYLSVGWFRCRVVGRNAFVSPQGQTLLPPMPPDPRPEVQGIGGGVLAP